MAVNNGDSGRVRSTADEQVLEAIFNPEQPAGGGIELEERSDEVEVNMDSEEVRRAKELEVAAIWSAEEGRFEVAVELLSEAVAIAHDYPSLYNNRAQVYRLKGQIDLALEDLHTAIQLSGGRGKAAAQAYTQRGLIQRLHGNNEEAKEDFQAAAKLGNKFAQRQLVHMNPYAALCGQMLSEVFDKLKRGELT